MFVALVASLLTSDVIGDNVDRIGTIMAMVSEMARNVAKISGALKETTNHVAKVESTLDDVVRRETTMEKMVGMLATQSKDMDKKIEGKLNDMDTKIEAVSTQSKNMDKKINAVSTQSKDMDKKIEGKLLDMDTKIDNIEASKNRFPFGWKYLGRGTERMSDDQVLKQPATFTECVNICEKKRASDSSWNGFIYYASGQSCTCFTNDRGHNMNYPEAVHFRYE